MANQQKYVSVEFHRFKAFKEFRLNLRSFNILVGPNNAGKSTILVAFRILAAAMRRASSRKAEIVEGPQGPTHGHKINLAAISVAEENIFFNYDSSEPAWITFTLSNSSKMKLYFPEENSCLLLFESVGRAATTPSAFRTQFNAMIGFVPILGPVEHNEPLYEQKAARLALFNYGAARNFRNIWYHFPEAFDDFRELLKQTWPGMDIEPPEVEGVVKPKLYMFCPEERIPREIFWAGFGFQVWCQMLTHLIQSRDRAIFLIDEPDIYLHSDLQRQLLALLRNLGPDILVATHSTEIITEAETDDLVIVNKKWKQARRIRNPSQLADVFGLLGSNLNPILTQLAKTRRALFLEGKDFQILGKFARKLKNQRVGNRQDFAVIPVEGFNPERIRSMTKGIEKTLGGTINVSAIFDRDYRCSDELRKIESDCEAFCDAVSFHHRKEIENFLLVPSALDRAAARKIADRAKRTGVAQEFSDSTAEWLDEIATSLKSAVSSQLFTKRRRFERARGSGLDDATITRTAIDEFDVGWPDSEFRLSTIPGKQAISELNGKLQKKYKVSITPTAIIDAMKIDEIPVEMKSLISRIDQFALLKQKGK